MHILSIKTAYPYQDEINKLFQKIGHSLTVIDTPPSLDEDSTPYLHQLLAATKKSQPDFLFSLGFYPFVSLACGALGIPYVCWLIDGFQPAYYTAAILNDWNHVFTIDSSLAKELSNLGVKHAHFLPFGVSMEAPVESNIGTLSGAGDTSGIVDACEGKYIADLSFIGTCLPREAFDQDILHADSPLPDASKGYLEGCLACQTQLHSLPSICTNLPETVWTDLQTTYPATDKEDCEDPRSYYEHRYFNPMISSLERIQHFDHAAKLQDITAIRHYGALEEEEIGKLTRCPSVDWYREIPIIAQNSKINLCLAHRDYKAAIPPIAWAVLGAGGFLLANAQEDFSIFTSAKPATFTNPEDFREKVAYYIGHEEERLALSEALHQEVQANHTLLHRITEMIANLL